MSQSEYLSHAHYAPLAMCSVRDVLLLKAGYPAAQKLPSSFSDSLGKSESLLVLSSQILILAESSWGGGKEEAETGNLLILK